MKKHLHFVLSLATCTLNAQVYFNPPTKAFNTGTAPTCVITVDVNNDSKMDMVVANSGSNNVSVLLGQGGTFAAPVNFNAGVGAYAVCSADFNNDNKVDLAVSNNNSNNISVLLGNGLGNFAAATNFATGTGPRSIACADVNGDNNIDLVTGNYNGANVSVLPGNGAGSFGAATNFATGNGPRSVLIADFNGDAKADLAVSNETSNNVSVLLGTGSGTFNAASNFGVGTNPHSITCADFNGDTKKDLATANGSNNISVLIGTGTGSFNVATNFAAGTSPWTITSSDFNLDGKIDLAVGNVTADNYTNISVLAGNGSGGFGAVNSLESTIWTVQANPQSISSGDLTGDGRPDIIVANNAYNTASILKNYAPTVGNCPNPIRIVILGASSSFGFGATDFDSAYAYLFRQYVIDSVNGYSQIINLAHAGYTTYAMQPKGYPAPGGYPVDTLRNITRALALNPDAVIINFVTNDVNALFTLDTIRNNFLRVTNLLNQAAIPYWITTTQPRNFTGDPAPTIALKKQMLLDLRDTIIKYYPLNNIESYVGFADVNGDILPQFDCGDNTHFTNAGHRKLYNNVKAVNIPGVICQSTALSGFAANENILVYPNPSPGKFTIQTSTLGKKFVRIYDLNGKQVFSEPINGTTTLDLTNLQPGVYNLLLKSSQKTENIKLVIIK